MSPLELDEGGVPRCRHCRRTAPELAERDHAADCAARSAMPRPAERRAVAEWPGLLDELRLDRELRLNLLAAIVQATRDEWRRRRRSGNGVALVGEEGKALGALNSKLESTFRELDEAAQRVALWSATIEIGDSRGWGRK